MPVPRAFRRLSIGLSAAVVLSAATAMGAAAGPAPAIEPSPSPTAQPPPLPSPTPTFSPSPSPTPTFFPSPSPTPTFVPSPSPTPTFTPSPSPTITPTPSPCQPPPAATPPADPTGASVVQDEMEDVASRISDLVIAQGYPGFTGQIGDPDHATLVLCWLRGDPLPDPVASIVANPGQPILVVRRDADYSYAFLESRVDSILDNSQVEGEIGGNVHTVTVPEEGTGLFAVVAPDDPNVDPGQFLAQAGPVLAAAAGVPVTVSLGAEPAPFTRLADVSPWFGGARITDNPIRAQCTSGFGIVRAADRAQLLITANHCYAPGQAVFNGPPVGNPLRQQIGTVAINVPRGDSEAIAIAAPGRAGGSVYVGDVGGPTEGTIAVTAVGVSIPNQFVCTSGSFTGEACLLRVLRTNVFVGETVRGARIRVGPLNQAASILRGPPVPIAAGQGDSGGPVIMRGASRGQVDGMGQIITGTNQFPCAPAPRVCSSDVIYNKLDFLMRNYGAVLA